MYVKLVRDAALHVQPKGTATAGKIDNAAVEATRYNNTPPRFWRSSRGHGANSAEYLRFYCLSIGLDDSSLRRVQAAARRRDMSLKRAMRDPQNPSIKDADWIAKSLHCHKALPTTLSDPGESQRSPDHEQCANFDDSLYDALPDDGDTIRLLQLSRDSRSHTLRARLIRTRLSHSPSYYAISYEWRRPIQADSTDTSCQSAHMILNGRGVTIQPNLYDFLMRLEAQHHHVPLWVDALCIDQVNNEEKSKQVSLMGDIYHKAGRVLVWLGRESQGSGNLLRLIGGRSVYQLMDVHSSDVCMDAAKHPGITTTYHLMYGKASDICTHATNNLGNTKAVWHLLRRPYWTRAWIIQEIVLAHDVILFCGDQCVDLRDTASLLFNNNHNECTAFGKIHRHRMVRQTAIDRRMGRYEDEEMRTETRGVDRILSRISDAARLPRLLETYEHTECSIPHDKVYSLLSFSRFSRDGMPELKADYRLTSSQLFFQAFNSFEGKRDPKYAELLRKALNLQWEDLLAIADHAPRDIGCACTTKRNLWWDISYVGNVTESSALADETGEPQGCGRFCTFNTDSLKHSDDLFEFWYPFGEVETGGVTMVELELGDFVYLLSGTDVALVQRARDGGFINIGIALMIGTNAGFRLFRRPLSHLDMLRPHWHPVIIAGYHKGDLHGIYYSVMLCVHQFIKLLACAVPQWNCDEDALPKVPSVLLNELSCMRLRDDGD